jgi:hypothetical protein
MPAKLMGDLALPLLNTPFEAICAIYITFNEMRTVLHLIGFIAVPIVVLESSSNWWKG